MIDLSMESRETKIKFRANPIISMQQCYKMLVSLEHQLRAGRIAATLFSIVAPQYARRLTRDTLVAW